MAPCPRCRRENPPTAATCSGCGSPLALAEERAPAPLDVELDLDRRRRSPEGGSGPAPLATAADGTGPFDPGPSDGEGGAPIEEPPPTPEEDAEEEGARAAPPARRAAAWVIDGGLVLVAAIALPAAVLPSGAWTPGVDGGASGRGLLPALLLSEAFVAVLAFVYATAAHALAGATLGKRIARIRVVGPDGLPPGPALSAARSGWALVSLALLGAGMLPALLSRSGRALHDLLAGTRVVEGP